MSVVPYQAHARGCEEGACAGASFLVESGLVGLEVLVLPPGVGAAVVPAGALGDELADLGDEPHAGVGFLGGVELLLQFVRGEPQPCVASGLVVGDQPVVYEPGYADGSLGVLDLSAGEFQLYHDGGWFPAVRAGTGLLPFFAF